MTLTGFLFLAQDLLGELDRVSSPPGDGTVITAELPCEARFAAPRDSVG